MKFSHLLYVFIVVALFACVKPGPGGKTDLDIRVLDENAVPMVGVPVYVQYGTSSGNGNPTKNYDDVITTNYRGQSVFEGMKKGEYFFYAEAIIDSTVTDTVNQIKVAVWGIGNTSVKIATRDLERASIINLEPQSP